VFFRAAWPPWFKIQHLLDRAPGLTPTSRLGCQAVINDPNAEIVIVVPRYTINQVSEAAEE